MTEYIIRIQATIAITKDYPPPGQDPAKLLVHTLTGATIMDLTTGNQAKATFTPLTKHNNPVQNPVYQPNTKPDWSGLDGVCQLLPADDGMSCNVLGLAVGTGLLTATAPMVASTGNVSVSGTMTVVVTADPTANDPTSLQIAFGPATPQ